MERKREKGSTRSHSFRGGSLLESSSSTKRVKGEKLHGPVEKLDEERERERERERVGGQWFASIVVGIQV